MNVELCQARLAAIDLIKTCPMASEQLKSGLDDLAIDIEGEGGLEKYFCLHCGASVEATSLQEAIELINGEQPTCVNCADGHDVKLDKV